jgi:DNA replication protein DnaC
MLEKIIGDRQAALFGERYRGASLSKLELSSTNAAKVGNFLKGKKDFLIYCGNPGIGKTYFCAALLEYALTKFESVRYWNESELLKRVRSSMEEVKGDYLECLKLLIDDEFVMIDDIGSTGLNEWRKEIIFDAIDERYNSMKPTVVTSNFSVAEFKEFFHERVSSRLFAKDNYVIEILDGQDLRQ